MKKKRKPIFLYFILMVLLFVILFFAQQIFLSFILSSILGAKNGISALAEIVWAGLVLIIVLIFGNKYIFTQTKENYFKSLKYIMPELVLSALFFLLALFVITGNANPVSFGDIFNLALFCVFIGIVEEFLCRGWLFNEFLERYSDSKKHIITSVILSSLIFGLIHFVNVSSTQGLLMTIIQVINATVGGIFLALVYYKTKNIWVVVTSHALWDFTLMMLDVNSLGSCIEVGSTNSTMIFFSCLQSIGLTIGYLLFCYWMFRKTDLYSKNNSKSKNWLVVCGVIIYLFSLLFVGYTPDDFYLCPNYTREKLKGSYKRITYESNSDSKIFELSNYPFEFVLGSDNRLLLNNTTNANNSIELVGDVIDYVLVENEDDYAIAIQNSDNTVLFGKFKFSEINYNNDYLNMVKDNLILVVGPTIGSLGVIEASDKYSYIYFTNEVGEILYFDEDGNLKINK